MSKPTISVADFIKLSSDEQGEILYKLNLKELVRLRMKIKAYAKINGNNDALRQLADTIFNYELVRCIEEEPPVSITIDEILRDSPPTGTDLFSDKPVHTKTKSQTLLEQFLKLSHKKKVKMLYELDSVRLGVLWIFLDDYISINGSSDDLLYFLDMANNLSHLRYKKKKKHG